MDRNGNFEVENSGWHGMSGTWCLKHKELDSVPAMRGQYDNICSSRGGQLDDIGGYRDKTSILCVAGIAQRGSSDRTIRIEILVMEPKGDVFAAGYIQELRRLNYYRKPEELAGNKGG